MSSTANVRSTTLQYGASLSCPTDTAHRFSGCPRPPPHHGAKPHRNVAEQPASSKNLPSLAGWPYYPMRGRPHPNQRPHRTLIDSYATHPPPSPCRLRATRAQMGRVERKKLNREKRTEVGEDRK